MRELKHSVSAILYGLCILVVTAVQPARALVEIDINNIQNQYLIDF